MTQVKRSEHGIIIDPISLPPDKTIRDALQLMERYHISGVPITEGDGHLVGILTNRDIRFETNFGRSIRELMTKRERLVTAPIGTTLEQAQAILQEHRIEASGDLLVVGAYPLNGSLDQKRPGEIEHHKAVTSVANVPLPEMDPVRARPSEARRAMRFNWWGNSGASVATTMMMEPTSPFNSLPGSADGKSCA